MGVYESYAKIKQSAQDMGLAWEQTRAVWKDVKAAQFEEEFVEKGVYQSRRARNRSRKHGCNTKPYSF